MIENRPRPADQGPGPADRPADRPAGRPDPADRPDGRPGPGDRLAGRPDPDPREPRRWPGYAAAACALAFAAVSFYWAAGGRYGLDLVGRQAVQLADRNDPAGIAALLVTGVLKVAGAVLALALVQPWGRRFGRRLLLIAGWGCSVLLTGYGAVLILTELLVVGGVIRAPQDMDWRGFHGHLYLWDPWFLVWGLLLALATRSLQRAGRSG